MDFIGPYNYNIIFIGPYNYNYNNYKKNCVVKTIDVSEQQLFKWLKIYIYISNDAIIMFK